jgi:hypothetical protein
MLAIRGESSGGGSEGTGKKPGGKKPPQGFSPASENPPGEKPMRESLNSSPDGAPHGDAPAGGAGPQNPAYMPTRKDRAGSGLSSQGGVTRAVPEGNRDRCPQAIAR